MNWFEVLRRLWDPIATPISLAAGALATHLWRRYLNRLAVFRWSVAHHNVAVAGTDPNFGQIQILWNNAPVGNLQFCFIELENESSRDFENVEVKFWYVDGTNFLARGTVFGTHQGLPWSPGFAALLAHLAATPVDHQLADDVQFALTHREYVVPIFNRETKLTFAFLVHPPTIQGPTLQVACEHKGVRLYQRPQRPMVFGVVQAHASGLGLVLAILLALAVGAAMRQTWIVASTAFIFGAFAQGIGAGAIHLKRWVVRTIG